jgi:hypothetical protein
MNVLTSGLYFQDSLNYIHATQGLQELLSDMFV